MKKIDLIRLMWNELKLDKYNMILVFILETVLFLNIIIVLLCSFEIDSVFDSYCRQYVPEAYNVYIYNVDESKLQDLEKDGFKDMELCYDEQAQRFFTFAEINSIQHFDYKLIKWKMKGVTIEATAQDLVDLMIFMKAIFVFISVLGVVLCALAVGNFYLMKIQKRVIFTNMLIRLGMPSQKIGVVYRIPFFLIGIISILAAYILSFPVLGYFNELIRRRFAELSISTDKREILTIAIFILFSLYLLLLLRNRWKRLSQC